MDSDEDVYVASKKKRTLSTRLSNEAWDKLYYLKDIFFKKEMILYNENTSAVMRMIDITYNLFKRYEKEEKVHEEKLVMERSTKMEGDWR